MEGRLHSAECAQIADDPKPSLSSETAQVGISGQVFAARVRLLYSSLRLLVVGNAANAAILSVVQRNVVEPGVILAWLAFFSASIVWRVALTRWFVASKPPDEAMALWARRYVMAVAWTGAAWGLAGIFLLPETSSAHQIVTAFVLGGVAAGAVTTLSPVFSAYLAFVVPTLVPIAVQFLLMGGETGYGMAAMNALFLAYLLRAGYSQGEELGRTQGLAIERAALVADLVEQKAVAEGLNVELRKEVTKRERIAADLRQREASLAKAQRIAGLASWEWDLETNGITGSAEAFRIYAIDRRVEDFTFDKFMDMVHPDDRDAVTHAVRHILEDKTIFSVEHRAIAADGTTRVLHQRAEPVLDDAGEVSRISGTTHDITEQHRIRESLQAESLRAEEASQAKSRFLANMSHEFRTPLNAIIGYSELLREDALVHGQARGATDLERINMAGKHLLAMVDEVLDFSKIEAGKTHFSVAAFDVMEMVGEAVATVRWLVESNGNRLILESDPRAGRMEADAVRVRQMLYNLLSNAGKFTERGDVRVTVRRIEEPGASAHGGWIEIAVADTGIGMDPDRLDAAFEAFGQLDPSPTRRHGGTGLGLAITKHYCELMGGTISVTSQPGKGSTFTLRLPVRASQAGPTEEPNSG
ncbi:MAG: PAS domain-containing protein [Rhodospirillales bacterium]|nr:MAG: PAS domain-containing protein [Rhodospirillales bacterium]